EEIGEGPAASVAIRVDGLTEELHLPGSRAHEGHDLGEDVVHVAAHLAAAGRRDDAERAPVIAALDDGDVGLPRRARVAPDLLVRKVDRVVPELGVGGMPGRPIARAEPVDEDRKARGGAGPDDEVDVGRPLEDRRALLLRDAAAHAEDEARLARLQAPEAPELREDLLLRLLPDRARVEENDVGFIDAARAPVAVPLERPRHLVGIEDVHLAAPGFDEVPGRAHECAPSPSSPLIRSRSSFPGLKYG